MLNKRYIKSIKRDIIVLISFLILFVSISLLVKIGKEMSLSEFRSLMTPAFISIMLESVTPFSSVKNSRNRCKCLYYSQSLSRISFHVMAENWKHLKDARAFSSSESYFFSRKNTKVPPPPNI